MWFSHITLTFVRIFVRTNNEGITTIWDEEPAVHWRRIIHSFVRTYINVPSFVCVYYYRFERTWLSLTAKLMSPPNPKILPEILKSGFRWTFSDFFIQQTVTIIARKLNFSGFPQKNCWNFLDFYPHQLCKESWMKSHEMKNFNTNPK